MGNWTAHGWYAIWALNQKRENRSQKYDFWMEKLDFGCNFVHTMQVLPLQGTSQNEGS